jgi:hypothetical protein
MFSQFYTGMASLSGGCKVRERFNLRKLNDLEVRKQYQLEITNRFAALENVRTT